MASIFDVAKCILDIKGTVSSYELQKLCYYCQAWSLALGEGQMFPEVFEAWPHGPVCRTLFAAHRGEFHVKKSDIAKGNIDNIPPKMMDVILSVLDVYSGLNGDDLEKLTHTEDPWIIARHGLPETARCSETISENIMQDFYRKSDKYDAVDNALLLHRAKRRAETNARTFSFEEVFNMSGLTEDDLLNAEDVEIES